MKKLFALSSVCLAIHVQARIPTMQLPAEVTKTTEAFIGLWNVDGSLTLPNAPMAAKVSMKMDCKQTALGMGVNCDVKGEIAGMGPLEMGVLVSYDVPGKAVHFMAVTSMGEVHDHKGAWKDDKTVLFEPLHGSAGEVEDLEMSFPDAQTMIFKAVTKMPDGSTVAFEGNGKK